MGLAFGLENSCKVSKPFAKFHKIGLPKFPALQVIPVIPPVTG